MDFILCYISISMPGNRRPPCPDPDNYIWVNTKEGCFWRKKRGLQKPATLNAAYQQSSNHLQICSPVAKDIVRLLKPHLHQMQTGRLHARLSGKLLKALNESGTLHHGYPKDFDLQPDYPLGKLLLAPYLVKQDNRMLIVELPIDEGNVRQHSRLVTDYYFELILVWDDEVANALTQRHLDSVISPLYPIGSTAVKSCLMEMPLPEGHWMALLKVNCLEGNAMAVSPRNYGMRVVGVG